MAISSNNLLNTLQLSNHTVGEILSILPQTDLVDEAKEIMEVQYYIISCIIDQCDMAKEDIDLFRAMLGSTLKQTEDLKIYD